MISGWISAVELGADGGGTSSLTIGCPDDFFAVRLGFANVTSQPWKISKAIGCVSAGFNDYVNPTGNGKWIDFTFVHKGADDDRLVARPTNRTEITVWENSIDIASGNTANPSWTWTDWAPIRSLEPDPSSGMRVLMLRALIPHSQTICFANSQLRNFTSNLALNFGFDYFIGGIKFNYDRIADPQSSSRDKPETWLHNQLATGSLFPIVQFLTRNAGVVGITTGDSHHQGTSTTDQMANYLYRATTRLGSELVGNVPMGMVNCAVGGLTSEQFFPRMTALLSAVRPSYAVLPGWSYNDCSGNVHADQPAVDLFTARLLHAIELCRLRGVVPIVLTPFPRNAEVMSNRQITPWRNLRQTILSMQHPGMITLDATSILGSVNDQEFDGTYMSGMSDDGAHPSDSGHASIADSLTGLLRRAIAIS